MSTLVSGKMDSPTARENTYIEAIRRIQLTHFTKGYLVWGLDKV